MMVNEMGPGKQHQHAQMLANKSSTKLLAGEVSALRVHHMSSGSILVGDTKAKARMPPRRAGGDTEA